MSKIQSEEDAALDLAREIAELYRTGCNDIVVARRIAADRRAVLELEIQNIERLAKLAWAMGKDWEEAVQADCRPEYDSFAVFWDAHKSDINISDKP